MPDSPPPIPSPGTDAPSAPSAAAAGPVHAAKAAKPAKDRKPRRKLSKAAIALLVASALAITGWLAFGISATQLNVSLAEAAKSEEKAADRIETLQSNSASLERDLDEVTESRNTFRDASDDVTVREKSVTERELAVSTREEAITATETRIKATTLTDGTYYTVGVSMEAGTYQTTSTSSRCYWAITKSGTNYDDIIENDIGGIGVLTVSVGGGQDFQSSGCGDWTKTG